MTDKREIVVQAPAGLILEGDPEQQLAYAERASKVLMERVEAKPRKVVINGKQYLEFGDWQTVGSFFGGTVGTEWVKPIERDGQIAGYEARAVVWRHGQMISAAEASCLRSEKNWEKRDEFAIKSMAQTRAGSKALRNAFGWVAELGGFAGTPAEEMEDDADDVTSDLFMQLDGVLSAAAKKGLNALAEAWGGLTPREQKIMERAKDNFYKPQAIEAGKKQGNPL